MIVAGHLYAHTAVDRIDRNSLVLFAWAIILSWLLVPVALAGHACYRSRKGRAAFSRPTDALMISFAGFLVAASPIIALGSGAAGLDNSSLRALFFAPLGPGISLLAIAPYIRSRTKEGPALGSLLLLLAALMTGVILWIRMVAFSDEYAYIEMASWLSRMLAGAGSAQTTFLYLSPFFVVYLSSGVFVTAFYLVSRRRRAVEFPSARSIHAGDRG